MTLEPFVMHAAAHLPRALSRPGSRQSLAALAGGFPAALTDRLIFEVALGTDAPPVDVSIFCRRGGPGVSILAGLSAVQLRPRARDHDVWSRLRTLCSAWLNDDPGLALATRLWLEFDHDGWESDVPVPCVFLGLHAERPLHHAALRTILDILAGPVSADRAAMLDRVLGAPAFARKHVDLGLMFSRRSRTIRLVFHGVGREALATLASLGLSPTDELHDVKHALEAFDCRMSVGIDVGAAVGPAVGLECQFSGRVGEDRSRWPLLLDHLVARQCCTRANRDAVLQWPGGTMVAFAERVGSAAMVRKINHVKVVWHASRHLEAKAYLLARVY